MADRSGWTDIDWAKHAVTLPQWRSNPSMDFDLRGPRVQLGEYKAACVPLPTPATKGCLLQRVRDVYGDPTAYVVPERPGELWAVWVRLGSDRGYDGIATGPTEWAALCAALEAAP